MKKKLIGSIKKTAITAVFLLASVILIREILILTRFIQNSDDRKFDDILFSRLAMNNPIKVSDIYGDEWNEVCVLYPYEGADSIIGNQNYKKQLIERYYLNNFMGFPPFVKYDDNIWWMFFVNESGEIVKLYRSSGAAKIEPGSDFKGNLIMGGSNYRVIDSKTRCLSRNNAFFIQSDEFGGFIKYFIFVEKE